MTKNYTSEIVKKDTEYRKNEEKGYLEYKNSKGDWKPCKKRDSSKLVYKLNETGNEKANCWFDKVEKEVKDFAIKNNIEIKSIRRQTTGYLASVRGGTIWINGIGYDYEDYRDNIDELLKDFKLTN